MGTILPIMKKGRLPPRKKVVLLNNIRYVSKRFWVCSFLYMYSKLTRLCLRCLNQIDSLYKMPIVAICSLQTKVKHTYYLRVCKRIRLSLSQNSRLILCSIHLEQGYILVLLAIRWLPLEHNYPVQLSLSLRKCVGTF